jgi:hypothetical protein
VTRAAESGCERGPCLARRRCKPRSCSFWLLDRKISANTVARIGLEELRAWLDAMPAKELAIRLIGGVTTSEIPVDAYVQLRKDIDPIRFVVPPLPNTLFTRDSTCWIYGGVSLNPMYWPARRQETLLATAIYRFHPSFRDAGFKVWFGDPDVDHAAATMEGGDVMPIGNGVVLCDGLFPDRLGRLSAAGVPAFGCVVSTALATVVLLSHFGGQAGAGGLSDVYEGIILLATITTLVPYAFCAMAELLLAVPRRGEVDGQRLIWTALIGILAFIFSFIAIIGAGPETALRGFAGLLLGLPVYVWLQRKRNAEAAPTTVSG